MVLDDYIQTVTTVEIKAYKHIIFLYTLDFNPADEILKKKRENQKQKTKQKQNKTKKNKKFRRAFYFYVWDDPIFYSGKGVCLFVCSFFSLKRLALF